MKKISKIGAKLQIFRYSYFKERNIVESLTLLFYYLWIFGMVWLFSSAFVEAEISPKWYWFFGFLLIGGIGYWCDVIKPVLSSSQIWFGIAYCSLSVAIYALLQKSGLCIRINPNIVATYDNPAGLASFLAFTFPIFLLGFRYSSIAYWKWGCGIGLLLISIAVISCGSRAGVLSLFCVITIYFCRVYYSYILKWSVVALLVALFVGGIGLYFCKPVSADGRLLIWRCTLSMISDNWFTGFGIGGFEANYMNYQAAYFEEHPNSRYALLADNVKHPFNEYLYVLSNYGIVGLGILFFAIGMCVRKAMYCWNTMKEIPLLILFSIAVFSLFSYPFRYPHTWFLCLLSCWMLLQKDTEDRFFVRKKVRGVATLILLICCTFLFFLIRAEIKWYCLAHKVVYTNKLEIWNEYHSLSFYLGHKPLFWYNYAASLNYHKKYKESYRIALRCEEQYADYYTQMLLADTEYNLKCYDKAIVHLRKAALMCPSRLLPWKRLCDVYRNLGNHTAASRLARQALSRPVKIQSSEVIQLQNELRSFL